MGTRAEAQMEAQRAARWREAYVNAQGKRRSIAGEEFDSAARMVAIAASRLYWG